MQPQLHHYQATNDSPIPCCSISELGIPAACETHPPPGASKTAPRPKRAESWMSHSNLSQDRPKMHHVLMLAAQLLHVRLPYRCC
jgi:hypothetical protein